MGDDTTDTTPTYDDVMRAARSWYYAEIRSCADEAIKECLQECAADDSTDTRREWLEEWVDQTTDSHEYVIYTGKAGMVLAASDNDSAYEDEIGEQGTVEARACFAMRADIWEILCARQEEWAPPDPTEGDDGSDNDESEAVS
jgi:hypothetical protein